MSSFRVWQPCELFNNQKYIELISSKYIFYNTTKSIINLYYINFSFTAIILSKTLKKDCILVKVVYTNTEKNNLKDYLL